MLSGYVQAAGLTPPHWPLHVPVPLHAARVPTGSPFTVLHTPSEVVSLHDWHWPSHLLSQHTPSTQLPLLQSAAAVHTWPFVFEQTPAASQLTTPLQVSSTALLTALQVPAVAVRLHAMHEPVQAELQQTPSAQKPLAHSPAAWQVWPAAFFARHLPAAQKFPVGQG